MFKIYKLFISPLLVVFFGHSCRFSPTCSGYMDEAIHRYGLGKGSVMGIKRIIRCNPFSKVSYDPVK